MRLIAHRGNHNGRSQHDENKVDYLKKALELGYDVETDVWFSDGKFYLGHDKPSFEVDLEFLLDSRVWCHAKNIVTLHALMKIKAHCFMHNSDDAALTSGGFIWTYPGYTVTDLSVAVMPEHRLYWDISGAYAVCSDDVRKYII